MEEHPRLRNHPLTYIPILTNLNDHDDNIEPRVKCVAHARWPLLGTDNKNKTNRQRFLLSICFIYFSLVGYPGPPRGGADFGPFVSFSNTNT
jgi:hypothetical protein